MKSNHATQHHLAGWSGSNGHRGSLTKSSEGLGDEGAGLHQTSRGVGGPESATVAWREGNLVLGAHMVCSERCPLQTFSSDEATGHNDRPRGELSVRLA